MSGEAKLGTAPPKNAERDAVHVAVYPCIAGEELTPGDRVKIEGGRAYRAAENEVGIADPFRAGRIKPGERLYVCLTPGTTIGMRHHWSHPQFDGDKSESEKWLREYAAVHNHYDDDKQAAFDRLIEGLRSGDLYFHGSDLHGLYDLDDADELKQHAEAYLGIAIDWWRFSFSCSC
jgi:hypothetical protein